MYGEYSFLYLVAKLYSIGFIIKTSDRWKKKDEENGIKYIKEYSIKRKRRDKITGSADIYSWRIQPLLVKYRL